MDKITGCYDYEIKMASSFVQQVQNKIQNGTIKRRNFIWLELTGCTGNTISLLDGKNPNFKFLASQMVWFIYENSLIVKQGESAIEQLLSVEGTDYILAVEGAVSTKANGLYNIIGNSKGKSLTALEAIKTLGRKRRTCIGCRRLRFKRRCVRCKAQPCGVRKRAAGFEKESDQITRLPM